jgi:hypothetical protein
MYNNVLGDNPATSVGPPLSIGWKVIQTNHLAIDDYEKFRPVYLTKSDILAPRSERGSRFLQEGYSRAAMKNVADELRKIRKSCSVNASKGPLEKLISFSPFHTAINIIWRRGLR